MGIRTLSHRQASLLSISRIETTSRQHHRYLWAYTDISTKGVSYYSIVVPGIIWIAYHTGKFSDNCTISKQRNKDSISRMDYGPGRLLYNSKFIDWGGNIPVVKERTLKMSEATRFLRGQFDRFGMKEYAEMYAVDSIGKSIKVRYGEELFFKSENNCKAVSDWIAKYDKKFSNRPSKNDGTLVNCQFIFKIVDRTYGFVQVGNYINKYDILAFSRHGGEDSESDISIYVFGRHYKKYIKELKDLVNHSNTNDLYIYNIKGEDRNDGIGVNSIGRVMDRRDLDTLFYNGDVKKTITDHIENFFANRHIYESKNLIYKTGILAYGEPGTGKTSLAMALASEYNYNLIVLDMTTFDKLDTSMLTSCINCDTDKFIILLEDIDTLFTTLNREDKEADRDTKAIINKMLQFLDSSSSPSDVIFLATTNHVDILDEALLRDGRFDLKVEIGNIDYKTAKKMIESFDITDEKVIDEIISRAQIGNSGLVNPATLQNKILEHFKEEVIKNEKIA